MPRCSKCSYYSDKTSNIKSHELTHSKECGAGTKSKPYDCQLCSESVASRGELVNHFSSVHDVVISKKHLTFESENAFLLWKIQIEKDTVSRFVQRRGVMRYKDHKTAHYYCHRDGVFKTRSTGKRRLKLLGSNKINACCPAQITATTYTDSGSVVVDFIDTHIGHRQELGRLHLSKDERKEIASKIAAGVQFKEILKGIRNSIQGENVNFIHLLTSKDLWNIQQEFNLNNEAVRHQNDYVSVHSWVTENQGNQVVRFYKQQGILLPSHPELSSDDFILIFANESQLTMLEEFGNDCVCLDGTHGLNQYDFELTTILVLDELRQGFPCAFMVSSRTDAVAMKIFFSVVKDQLDGPIAPKVFMSDMAEAYKNTWCDVMPPPSNVLYCSWHVDRAWKKNLSKIKGDIKKAEVYKTVRTLLEETDQNAFERLLAASVFSFQSDPEKRDFGTYFKSEYSGCARQWAFCYRAHLGLNTNMHLESLHKTIKHCYFEGKKVKRLDKCLNVLMRVIQDKLFNRIITCHRGKLTKKIADIRRRHTEALQMKDVQIFPTEQGWSISSSKSPTTFYSITPWKGDCSCDLRCVDCDICLHSFKCECLDSAIKWVICRHIHFMAINRETTSSQQDQQSRLLSQNDADNDGCLFIAEHCDKIQDVILKEISQKSQKSSLESRKKQLLDEYKAALEFAHNMDDLDICQNAVRPLIPTMKAARTTSEVFVPKREVNSLKKMSPQKNFFSTKNKRRRTESILRKPSAEEKLMLANSLLLDENNH